MIQVKCDICENPIGVFDPTAPPTQIMNRIIVDGREFADICDQCAKWLKKEIYDRVDRCNTKPICPECNK